jgi:hypothetical protein
MAQSKRKNIGQDIVWVTNFDCPNTTVWRTIWHDGEKYWVKLWGEEYEVERAPHYGWRVL